MHIAIDSTQKKITGVVSGRFYFEIVPFYDEVTKVFKKHYVNPPFHWSKISRKVKNSCAAEIIRLIDESKLKINLFYHNKPSSTPEKEYFHGLLPRRIAEHMEPWLRCQGGTLTIDVDRDYDLNKYNKTENFVKNIITQIGFRLVGKYIKIRDVNKNLTAELKQDNGEHLKIFGRVCTSNDSKGIQIIDIIMGIINDFGINVIDKNKLHIRKI